MAKTERAFAVLAELLATERSAADIVAKEGLLVPSAAGTSKPHPAVRSLEIARAQIVPLLKQFGLLPVGTQQISNKNAKNASTGGKSIWEGILN